MLVRLMYASRAVGSVGQAEPVSYTHLDVYKRQPRSMPSGQSASSPAGAHGPNSALITRLPPTAQSFCPPSANCIGPGSCVLSSR